MTPTDPDAARYTVTDLAALAGVTPRTVRYYLAQGLLPSVGVSGPGAKYDDGHLARLRLIRRLQQEHQPLAEIRRRLEGLDDAAILALTESEPAPPTESALDYIRRVTGGGGSPMSTAPMTTAPMTPPPVASASLLRSVQPHPPAAAPPSMPSSRLAEDAPPSRLRRLPPDITGSPPLRPTESPTTSLRTQWEHITLDPDVELHIRRPLTRPTAKRVDRLIEIARELFEEDPS